MKDIFSKKRMFDELADALLVTTVEVYSMCTLEDEEAEADDPSYDYKRVYDELAYKIFASLCTCMKLEIIQSAKQYDEIFEICYKVPVKLWSRYKSVTAFKKEYVRQAKKDIIEILNWYE